jgi:hypothetical protein
MEYKIFESSDTNVKKFVFEWGASAVTKKGIAEAVLYRYGEYRLMTLDDMKMANVSLVDERYIQSFEPLIIEL